MTIRPTAIKAYRFGAVCSQLGVKYCLIVSAALTAFSTTLWLANVGEKSWDHDLFALINIAITLILTVTYGLERFLLRKRTINRRAFAPEQYAFITDELRRRGIRNTRRFITAHPDHVRCAQALSRDLVVYDPKYRTVRYRFEALIYSEDSDPARAKDVIVGIVADRRITDPSEVRALLHTLLNTETPLGAGAL